MPPIFIIASIVSVAFMVLMAVGVVTYVRRTWQQIRSESDETPHDRLMDGIDQLQMQLYVVTERLAEIERQIATPPDSARLPGRSGGSGADAGGPHDEPPD